MRRESAGPRVIAVDEVVRPDCDYPCARCVAWLVQMKTSLPYVVVLGFSLVASGNAAAGPVLDSALAAQRTNDSILWFDVQNLDLEGRGWSDTKSFYDRLPGRAEDKVRKPVWDLSRHSAGMCVRFVTDATTIRARWVLTNPWLYQQNMTAIGVSGLDLYVKTEKGEWRWLAVGQPSAQTNSSKLVDKLIPGRREYLLYLPLHNGVLSLEIGVSEGASLAKAGPWGAGERKPIVFYGTSIQHGIAASRPGLVHNAILGRRFKWPTINLGFSGNGKMEIEMAELLAELDPAIYVLDCLPNLVADEIKERVEPFVNKLRAAHPQTPIVLVEDRTLQDSFLIQGRMEYYHLKDCAELKAAFERLKKSGVEQLYYIEGEHLLGDDGEGTTDGSHPNDLGFMRQAEVFEQVLKPILTPIVGGNPANK
jgi:GDSL-like Lipase/Acylhydrolase family/N-terminus of Esterase_SGNH_hydro-type